MNRAAALLIPLALVLAASPVLAQDDKKKDWPGGRKRFKREQGTAKELQAQSDLIRSELDAALVERFDRFMDPLPAPYCPSFAFRGTSIGDRTEDEG